MPSLDRCNKYREKGLWIRAAYMNAFNYRTTNAVVRAGNRLDDPNDFRHIPPDVEMPVRFIKRPGSGHDIPAELYPDDGTTVRRIGAVVKKISELTPEDLEGTTPDTATPELVRYHLAIVNNTPLPSPDEVVTIWKFEFCQPATE